MLAAIFLAGLVRRQRHAHDLGPVVSVAFILAIPFFWVPRINTTGVLMGTPLLVAVLGHHRRAPPIESRPVSPAWRSAGRSPPVWSSRRSCPCGPTSGCSPRCSSPAATLIGRGHRSPGASRHAGDRGREHARRARCRGRSRHCGPSARRSTCSIPGQSEPAADQAPGRERLRRPRATTPSDLLRAGPVSLGGRRSRSSSSFVARKLLPGRDVRDHRRRAHRCWSMAARRAPRVHDGRDRVRPLHGADERRPRASSCSVSSSAPATRVLRSVSQVIDGGPAGVARARSPRPGSSRSRTPGSGSRSSTTTAPGGWTLVAAGARATTCSRAAASR